MAKKSLEQRFFEKVSKTGECWLWTGARMKNGYGKIIINRKEAKAHRVSWELAHGPIPDGISVLHRCDTPPCVRPSHLFLGTQADNMADMAAKKRGTGWPHKGAKVPGAKLNEDQVREIRRLLYTGITQTELGRQFGVTNGAIHLIANRKNWKHI